MELTFLGAAKTVTGSMHLLTTANGSRILLDCGMYQGRRSEAFQINSHLPFDPSSIDAVVLSHAHIDHSGNLPSLVSGRYPRPFNGYIYATHATRDLCSIMLPDSAHIQESDAAFLRKKKREAVGPLYTMDDALQVIEHFAGVPYRRQFNVTHDVSATFYDAGHILGSAGVVLTVREHGKTLQIGFTGDVGRKNRPILRDPEYLPDVDVLISESTYGGRHHEPFPNLMQTLKETITRTTQRGGKVIIPAFAVGRTQDVVYLLNVLFERGELPRVPMYVDSPLAINATHIYRSHLDCFNREVTNLLLTDPDPFGFRGLQYLRSAEESKRLNNDPHPCVIISASGMMEAGRVVHHLMNHIEEERNTVLVIGFQAEHTLGRKIVEREPVVNIMGQPYNLRAEVKVVNGLSAHADHDELVDFIGHQNRERLQRVFLVHGEQTAQEALRDGLQEVGITHVSIPAKGAKFSFEATGGNG
ncbi:MAG: MBL fold metallo-hydrolase [Chlorobi bacterium]|nr:MAG: RNA-metabolising metallo-beta-lactamase [Chlorobi bacterium OLB7]MBK8912821.1 MBL fold metallo-hydrolase [Chlorobiota bacterium]MBX7217570.1 MBL fold metallo-hydrolase [Candidatus Kapabacteria bacterium]